MSIGVNLRVTGYCRQGGRKYMEDFFSVAYQQTEDEKDLEYAFIGIYDGHGGAEAAAFAKEHLMESIVKHKSFWSDNDDEVLRAIRDGYLATHYAMWKEQAKWPKTASGLPSTAGTTASVAFIRRGKIYVGHVGDSGIVLGYQTPSSPEWKAKPLTRDHKPENAEEISRIQQCGGKVVLKSGVPRVVWNRPRIGHQGPVRRSTPIDEIPFLAVARSLGDLWSYNSRLNQFIVSPNPDCAVFTIDTSIHRCLIFGTDGLYNMLSPNMAVAIVHQTEKHNEYAAMTEMQKAWLNPSKLLVERALEKWHFTNMRADNTSVVTLMLDPPGPPRAQVLKDRKKNLPPTGFKIITRFKDGDEGQGATCSNETSTTTTATDNLEANEHPITTKEDAPGAAPTHAANDTPERPPTSENSAKSDVCNDNDDVDAAAVAATETATVTCSEVSSNSYPLKERNAVNTNKLRESTSFDTRQPYNNNRQSTEKSGEEPPSLDDSIQINEISSSSNDLTIEHNNPEEAESENDHNQINNRHNLRSGGGSTCGAKTKDAKNINATPPSSSSSTVLKRKNHVDVDDGPLRKSVRLDRAKRTTLDHASYKENKIRRSGAAPASSSTSASTTLSLARRILKSKKINLKKRALKKPAIKKKLKLMVDAFKQGAACASLVKMASQTVTSTTFHRRNINVVEPTCDDDDDAVETKTPDRWCRSRSSAKADVIATVGGTYAKRAGSKKRTGEQQQHQRRSDGLRLRSSSIGDWKVTKVPKVCETTSTKMEDIHHQGGNNNNNKRMSRSLEQLGRASQSSQNKDGKKSSPQKVSPIQTQRKSLRQGSQNQSGKLRKRISQSK